MHIISYATTAQSPFQMVVKSNTVSLRHNHSPETLIIHLTQCIRNHFAFKILFSTKLYFQIFIFRKFYQNLFDFILFLFNLINIFFFETLFYNEQCSFSDSKKKNESKRIENRPSAPSAQPKASPRAWAARPAPRPRACRVRAARLACRCRLPRVHARLPPSLPRALHARLLRPARACCLAQLPSPSVAIQFFLYCDTVFLLQPSQPQYKFYCNTLPSSSVLQYTKPSKPISCNTIFSLATQKKKFLTILFGSSHLPFFLHKFFFFSFLFFIYFQHYEKSLKIFKIIFFFLYTK